MPTKSNFIEQFIIPGIIYIYFIIDRRETRHQGLVFSNMAAIILPTSYVIVPTVEVPPPQPQYAPAGQIPQFMINTGLIEVSKAISTGKRILIER